ncbi:NAD-binding protein [Streptacidiphilus jiangxiensis]|uniref:Trk K+ transport system, NAD-binding component n=1 Tax=Streptacidiphilus jiangxiensis TaxID=235985 RepID=A0A1H8A4S2_STRJI|nr:NAD(P)-binding protein [Streptacidiphilus jiangxiensis]SEM64828.1 Trk K+ transport system, NAD-binding component [Streptacidiphilus jiangxiensis]
MPDEELRGHMVVVGNDALTQRLAGDLAKLYQERVVVVVPEPQQEHGPQLVALHRDTGPITVIAGRRPDEPTLRQAGVADADALAIVLDDDQAVTAAALTARGINPHVRLALRVHSTPLGKRLRRLLDRPDAPTTVASASQTAAPALVSSALPDQDQVIAVHNGTCTVVSTVLPAGSRKPEPGPGVPGAEIAVAVLAEDGDLLLPDTEQWEPPEDQQVTLVTLRHHQEAPTPEATRAWSRMGTVLRSFFSRKLQVAAAGLATVVALLTVLTWQLTGTNLGLSLYLVLLDLSSAGNPAFGQPVARQVLQIVTMFTGMLILGLVAAIVLDSVGAVRPGDRPRRVRRTMNNHVVLIGIGSAGTAVVSRLVDMRRPVVVVERNPEARNLAAVRARGVPVVLGEFTRDEVWRAARGDRASAVMALTNNDSANLQAVLFARERRPDVPVVLRLFDEGFARTVFKALREAHPNSRTRSRSVSYLAAPAFAAAMVGRRVLAAIPARREILLLAEVTVTAGDALAGQTVKGAFRPGDWRVVAVRQRGQNADWNPDQARHLQADDRVVVVATRAGLGRLLRRTDAPQQAAERIPGQPTGPDRTTAADQAAATDQAAAADQADAETSPSSASSA